MEVIRNNTSSSAYWYSKLLPVGLIILVAALYFETTEALFTRWIMWDEGLSHGLVVIGLFLYFLFSVSPIQSRKDNIFINLSSLILLGAISLIWYLASLINIYVIEQLSLLAIIFCLFASIFGFNALKQHYTLLLLPIFAIPIWDQLSNLLVNLSGFVVGKMVKAIDMPAVIDGNSIFIPFGEIVIADGCSGLRYLVISLAIAYVISYLNGYSLKKFIIALGIATIIGLFANWLRIFILVIIGYETQMQSSLMSDHEYFGWALFAAILFPAIYFAPVVKQQTQEQVALSTPQLPLISIIALSIGPILAWTLTIEPKAVDINNQVPHQLLPIQKSKMPMRIESGKTDKTENAVDNHSNVFVEIDHFQRKNKEEKLVPYIQRLYDHVAWSLISEHQSPDGDNIKIFRNKHRSTIVAQLQWFDVGGIRTSHYSIAKLLQVPAMIRGKNSFKIYTLQSVCNTSSCLPEIEHIIQVKEKLTVIN